MASTISLRKIRSLSPQKVKLDPFVYIPDWLAPFFVKLILGTSITPNQLSLFAYLLHVLGAVFLALNTHLIYAFILFQLVLLVDCMDGALARAKKMTSKMGEFYEYTFHETASAMLYFALGSFLYTTEGSVYFLYMGSIIVLCQLIINSFGTSKPRIMYQHYRKKGKLDKNAIDGTSLLKESNTGLEVILRLIHVFPNYAFLCGMITIGYFVGFLEILLGLYFIYFVGLAILKVIIELARGFKPFGLK